MALGDIHSQFSLHQQGQTKWFCWMTPEDSFSELNLLNRKYPSPERSQPYLMSFIKLSLVTGDLDT
jgi:hypothetical protein